MSIAPEELLSEAKGELPEAVALRRRLHANPEIGNDLPETREAVLEAIADLDLELELCEQTSGIVATLRGAERGRTILLRADMDALPMPEDSGLEFASTRPGRMHACGHDAHTAMLVGAARLLARRRDSLPGDVKLFFQPGEEGHFGAKLMLDEGVLEGPNGPDAVFALHIDPRLGVGRTASRAGPLLASADVWSVELRGKGGHASMPHITLDPIPAACEIVSALQTMVTRRVNAFDPVVLTTTQIEAGTTTNVIPETAKLLGTLRATSEHARETAEEGIHRVVHGICEAHGLESTVNVARGYPVTVNDTDFTDFAREVVTELLGERAHYDLPNPIMGAEDFSYLLQRWPGAMLFLGMREEGAQDPAPCHSNRMRISEDGMAVGIALYAAIALRYLAESH
jgi:hippurate hydrolase